MKLNMETLQNKIMPFATKLEQNKYLSSISAGLASILPAIIVGAIATLLNGLPINGYQSFLESIGVKPYLGLTANFTTDIIALLAVFFIASRLCEKFEVDGFAAGLFGVISFLILTPIAQVEGEEGITNFISFEWLGAAGLFVAIILGLLIGRLYVWIINKGIIIRMPEGVPPTITKSFAGLIPGFIITALVLIMKAIFDITPFGSLHQFIYTFVQTPLQGLGGTLWALLIAVFVVHLLWFFGIHGMMTVLSVMMPIWLALDLQNLEAYQAGEPLPNIVGFAFVMCYTLLGGSGATLGLNLLMLFRSKSARYKTLGKISIPAGICGINEPILFGTPLVLNPVMVIPFILTPLITTLLAYIITAIGIVPAPIGTRLPLGAPIIMTGLLSGSVKIAILQVLLVFVTIAIYYPFFRMADNAAYEEESGGTGGSGGEGELGVS